MKSIDNPRNFGDTCLLVPRTVIDRAHPELQARELRSSRNGVVQEELAAKRRQGFRGLQDTEMTVEVRFGPNGKHYSAISVLPERRRDGSGSVEFSDRYQCLRHATSSPLFRAHPPFFEN